MPGTGFARHRADRGARKAGVVNTVVPPDQVLSNLESGVRDCALPVDSVAISRKSVKASAWKLRPQNLIKRIIFRNSECGSPEAIAAFWNFLSRKKIDV